jgi:desulfoferrodoxin-like iron-binding protein
MFNRIVAATDTVTTSDAPVLSAARMARQQGARLYLLHVMESASTENRRLIRHFETGAEMTADADYEDSVRQALEKNYKDDLSDLSHEVRVTAGFPWEEVLRWAEEIDTDLIVLGPHSTRAEEKGVVRIAGRVGSTVENVVASETCPVMVVNRPAEKDQIQFQRVLVAVDFSRSCECAVCLAAKLAAHYHSRLFVFHMIPVPPVPKYTRTNYTADTTYTRRRLGSFYATYLDKTDHQYVIRAGALPHLEILSYANKSEVDLIIMGSHTKEKPGKWYPGSSVERVGYRTTCPVLVVNDPKMLARWGAEATSGDEAGKDRLIHLFTGTPPEKPANERRTVMTTKSEVFKCKACGAIVAVIAGGKGELVCCDQKMAEVTPDKAKKLIHEMNRPGTP